MRALMLLTSLLLAFGASRAGAQTVCPPDNQKARAVTRAFVSDARVRSTLGMPAILDLNSLRLLTDATDSSACSFIRTDAKTTPEAQALVRWSYYTVGGFYFAVAYRVDSSGQNVLGPGGLFVYGPAPTYAFKGLHRM